jgi:hypothetical protein
MRGSIWGAILGIALSLGYALALIPVAVISNLIAEPVNNVSGALEIALHNLVVGIMAMTLGWALIALLPSLVIGILSGFLIDSLVRNITYPDRGSEAVFVGLFITLLIIIPIDICFLVFKASWDDYLIIIGLPSIIYILAGIGLALQFYRSQLNSRAVD